MEAQTIQAVQVQALAQAGVGALAGTARDGFGVRAPTIQVVQGQSPGQDGVGVGVWAPTIQVVQVQARGRDGVLTTDKTQDPAAPALVGVGVLKTQTTRDLAAPVLAGAGVGEVTQKVITQPTMHLESS